MNLYDMEYSEKSVAIVLPTPSGEVVVAMSWEEVERSYWWWAQYAEKKMKPCPFCGGKGSFDVDHILGSLVYVVYCTKCSIEKRFGESKWKDTVKGGWDFTEQQIYRGLLAKALLFWNTRGG